MESQCFTRVFVLGWVALLQIAVCSQAHALGKSPAPSPSASPVAKKILNIDTISNVQIDIPASDTNGPSFYDFGPDLQESLVNALSAQYDFPAPANSSAPQALAPRAATSASTNAPVAPWDGTQLVPAATLKFHITALAFRTGGRGDSMFYGFDERFHTIYNDGSGKLQNDFPLSPIDFAQSDFDAAFNDRGTAPFDSQGGLDLGEGFQVDALVAWVQAKWASYHSEIHMQVEMNAPLVGRHETKEIMVTGHGFFFDIVAGYLQFSGEIGVARKDAMTVAFNNAFAGSSTVINNWMAGLPHTAYLYTIISPTQILLNTGINANIPVGTLFYVVGQPGLVLEVNQVSPSGSVAQLNSGSISALKPGMTLVDSESVAAANPGPVTVGSAIASGGAAHSNVAAGTSAVSANAIASAAASAPTPVASESVNLPSTNLPKADYSGVSGLQISLGQGILDSLVQFPLLPYRIWRYFQYDESYQGTSAQIAANDPNSPDFDYDDDVTPRETSSEANSASASRSKDAANYSRSAGTGSGSENGTENGAGALAWSQQVRSQAWAKQIGLNLAPVLSGVASNGSSNGAGGSPVVVAVIDSGVDYNHPALRDSLWVNPSPFTDPLGHVDTNGWDFISGDQRPYDDLYRGTETASALLAVAPEAVIMPLKAFNPWGVTSSAALYGSFQYAVDHGAQVIVCSWATRRETGTMQAAIQYARDHGVLVVAAAGDRGDNLSQAGNAAYPAVYSKTFDNVLTVAGVNAQDQLVAVSGHFSNFDPSSVQIAAPGENILVADPRDHTSSQTSTGLAAAMVAGQVVRNLSAASAAHDAIGTYHDWIKQVLSQADVVPALNAGVQGGLRLHVR